MKDLDVKRDWLIGFLGDSLVEIKSINSDVAVVLVHTSDGIKKKTISVV